MKTMKSLVLAGFAVMSLGVGTAMAQEGGGPSMPTIGYWTAKELAAQHAAAATDVSPVQAGSSDIAPARPGLNSGWAGDHDPYRFDYGTLANPG